MLATQTRCRAEKFYRRIRKETFDTPAALVTDLKIDADAVRLASRGERGCAHHGTVVLPMLQRKPKQPREVKCDWLQGLQRPAFVVEVPGSMTMATCPSRLQGSGHPAGKQPSALRKAGNEDWSAAKLLQHAVERRRKTRALLGTAAQNGSGQAGARGPDTVQSMQQAHGMAKRNGHRAVAPSCIRPLLTPA